jgi:hypothetical protein
MKLRLLQITLGGSIALWAFAIPALAQTMPCVDTNGGTQFLRRTMAIRQAAKPEISITGKVVSLSPTGEVGFMIPGIPTEQKIRPNAIRLDAFDPSPMAQSPRMVGTRLGKVTVEFALSEVSIDQGVIMYPGCVNADAGHDMAFKGTLTFKDGNLRVDGEFTDYAFRSGDRPDIIIDKPGA